jgi:4-phosphopantoate--beta-alanine ligase
MVETGVVAHAGLIAHGRGEAFDYLLGETTAPPASKAIQAAAAMLLTAESPTISVNGNTAALVANDIITLAQIVKAKVEVNLFYRTDARETAIRKILKDAGADTVLGVGGAASARIPELGSERRRVDPQGILASDVVLVPLEDGDRAEALIGMEKSVIAVDLNPLSRTSQKASITIVDNVVRALPSLAKASTKLRGKSRRHLNNICQAFDNGENLRKCISFLNQRLSKLAAVNTEGRPSP